MSATEGGEYIVTVTRPNGTRWIWRGWGDNISDALARAENDRQEGTP